MLGFLWQYQVSCLILFFNLQVICSSSFHSALKSTKVTLCSHDQSFALLKFKNSFSINSTASRRCFGYSDSYPRTDFWKEGSDCCSWDGVTCDRFTGHVIGLDLGSSWLLGSINDNSSLFKLHHLQSLNLACNDFSESNIPSKFGWFSEMTYLNLSSSYFSGQVPTEISHLSKLNSLDLSDVDFSGGMELKQHSADKLISNLTELKDLHLGSVDMSSVAAASLANLTSSLISLSLFYTRINGEFPSRVFQFPSLQRLILSTNGFLTGSLPISNWSSAIRLLDLYQTSFSGNLPDTIGNHIHLNELHLSSCNFRGSIPASLGNLTGLTSLHLGANVFTGQVPAAISNLEQLIKLSVSYNCLSGQFPDVIGNLSKLTYLDISNNNFSGQFPSSLFNLSRLSSLDFSMNQLEGHFPYHVKGLSNLIELRLSYNFLTGRIPSWFFTLPSLEYLDLSNNKLRGPIDKLQLPGSLKYVNFRSNQIHGPIPNSISELVNLTTLNLSLNYLSGLIKSDMFSKLKNLEFVDLSHNTLLSLKTISNLNFTFPKLTRFIFSSCNLTEFPIFLRNSKYLELLDLSNNKISGRISQSDSELWHELRILNLSHNCLTSFEQIPSLSFLSYLDLRSNLLQGQLVELPDGIRFFSVSHNKLAGEIPLSYCKLRDINILDLSHNHLNGIIPRCLVNSSRLIVLDLRMNNFVGSIPHICAEDNWLEVLNLNSNQLEGQLSPSLVNCSYLQVLDVGNNSISDTFPHWLPTLPQLQVLILRSNGFYGLIDNAGTRFSFSNLRILDISHNGFTGLLPTRYLKNFKAMMYGEIENSRGIYMGNDEYQYSVSLTVKGNEILMVKVLNTFRGIDFSENHFQGQIPETIGKLHLLKVLNISHNNLTGEIPSSLGNLMALESLDLSTNKLVGKIPTQLTDIKFLSVLNLSFNKLVGPIPKGNQFDTFENNSYIGNLGLCGLPLSEKCNNDKAPEPSTSIFPEEYDTSSWFDWKIVMMGYASGLVIGLSITYIVFSTRKPRWFVRMIERAQLKLMERLKKFN